MLVLFIHYISQNQNLSIFWNDVFGEYKNENHRKI